MIRKFCLLFLKKKVLCDFHFLFNSLTIRHIVHFISFFCNTRNFSFENKHLIVHTDLFKSVCA